MKSKKWLVRSLFVAATGICIFAFQNATPNQSALDRCREDDLCQKIFQAMKEGRGLTTELGDEQKIRLGNEIIEHAANRLGFGLSTHSPIQPNLNQSNVDDRLARVAALIRRGLLAGHGNLYSDNEAQLRRQMASESTYGQTKVEIKPDGSVIKTPIKPYEGLTPQFLLPLIEIRKNSNYFSVKAKNAALQAAKMEAKWGNKSYQYLNAVNDKGDAGAAGFGYSNAVWNDEQRWSLIRKMVGSQSRNEEGGVDLQINLQEVLAEFWFNHFNIESDKAATYAGGKDGFDATLRMNFFGSFRDLLYAELTHPAMLKFLDNDDNCISGGVPSNQNLGREVLELHTLGQAPGVGAAVYNQADVDFASRVLAGVNVEGGPYGAKALKNDDGSVREYVSTDTGSNFAGSFLNPACATRIIAPTSNEMLFSGRTFDQSPLLKEITSRKSKFTNAAANLKQSSVADMVTMLANHKQTQINICAKLAAVFGGPGVENVLAKTCRDTWKGEGDLRSIYTAMITDPTFWSARNMKTKVKNPVELSISMARLTGVQARDFNDDPKLARFYTDQIIGQLKRIGLDYRKYVDPTGYQYEGQEWLGLGYLYRQIDASVRLSTLPETYNKNMRAPAANDDAENYLSKSLAKSGITNREIEQLVLGDLYQMNPTDVGPSYREKSLLADQVSDPGKVDERGASKLPARTGLTLLMATNWFLKK